jgi:hypothetical protein
MSAAGDAITRQFAEGYLIILIEGFAAASVARLTARDGRRPVLIDIDRVFSAMTIPASPDLGVRAPARGPPASSGGAAFCRRGSQRRVRRAPSLSPKSALRSPPALMSRRIAAGFGFEAASAERSQLAPPQIPAGTAIAACPEKRPALLRHRQCTCRWAR